MARHRAVYQETEAHSKSYRHASAPFDTLGLLEEATEGGHLDAYCDGSVLKLLVAEFDGENGDRTDRLYFEHDSLLFVFRSIHRGIPDGVHPYPVRSIIEDARFYFTDGRLIRRLGIRNRVQSVTSDAAKREATELFDEVVRFRAAMPGCTPHYVPADAEGAR